MRNRLRKLVGMKPQTRRVHDSVFLIEQTLTGLERKSRSALRPRRSSPNACNLNQRLKRLEKMKQSSHSPAPLPVPMPAPVVDPDDDGDFLSNSIENTIGTNPWNPDTDGDGIIDGDEVYLFNTNPLSFDTDGDGFPDGSEIVFGTNPLNMDPDDDGDFLLNVIENIIGTDIWSADTDADGIIDGEEVLFHSTDPTNADTDNDGIPDGQEVAMGTDPLN